MFSDFWTPLWEEDWDTDSNPYYWLAVFDVCWVFNNGVLLNSKCFVDTAIFIKAWLEQKVHVINTK